MADNVPITAGTGTAIAADDIGSVWYQRVKVTWGPDGTANDADVATGKPLPVQLRGSAGGDVVKLEDGASADGDPGVPVLAVRKATPANTSGADGDYEFLQMSAGRLWASATIDAALPAGAAVIGYTINWGAKVSTTITRPNDTTTYAAGDAWSTSGGTALTFTGCLRGTGLISRLTNMIIVDSAYVALGLQGELWLFNAAPTAIADNAAFTLTDAEMATVVAVIPFAISTTGLATVGAGGNSLAYVNAIGIDVTGAADANLYGQIKVLNAYVPVANEILTPILQFEGVN